MAVRLNKAQEARLAEVAAREGPEKAAEVRRICLLKLKEARAKQINPLGWYKPRPSALKFHQSTAKQRLATGGNRSGKTFAGCCELLFWLLGHSPYRSVPKNVTLIVTSETYDVQRNTIVETVLEMMPKNGSIRVQWTRDEKYIEGPNGKAILKSAEQGWRAFQGIALDGYWMDEEQDYEIRKQLAKRLKKGSELNSWFTLTPEPDRSDHWTYDELALPALEGRNDVSHFVFDLEDNRVSRGGFIADSEVDNLIAITPVDDRPAVIHGQYVKRGGLMYPMWSRNHHLSVERSLKEFLDGVRKGVYTPFASLDWGVRNPTAMGLFLEDQDENVHLVDEIYRPMADVNDLKREYKTRFATFQPVFVVADPSIWHNHDSTDPSKTIAGQLEASVLGLPGLPLLKGDNDVVNGLAAMRELLRVDPNKGAKLKVQPRCTNFIREIEAYVGEEWASAPHLRNKKETPRKQNDHAMDMARYFSMAPHSYIKPRNLRPRVDIRINPVTGYVRAAV